MLLTNGTVEPDSPQPKTVRIILVILVVASPHICYVSHRIAKLARLQKTQHAITHAVTRLIVAKGCKLAAPREVNLQETNIINVFINHCNGGNHDTMLESATEAEPISNVRRSSLGRAVCL